MSSSEETLSDLKAKRLKTNVAETSEVVAQVPKISTQHVDVDKPCPGGYRSMRMSRAGGEGMYDISEITLWPDNPNTE
jgi:hypothetical protein